MKMIVCKKYEFSFDEKKRIEDALEIGIINEGGKFVDLDFYGEHYRDYEDIAAEIIHYINREYGLNISETYTDILNPDLAMDDETAFYVVEYLMETREEVYHG